MKALVAYFSAGGSTAGLAETLAEAVGAELFEIQPETPYTTADLNWMDSRSRSTVEMRDTAARPAIKGVPDNLDAYDRVFVGFPIWWYTAPRIINTFLESCALSGKTIIPFATSGGSGVGKTNKDLLPSCKGAKLLEGRVFSSRASKEELAAWAKSL